MLPDYHTHTPLCKHAEGLPKDYAKRAIELGLTELGISDHSPMREEFDDWRMLWGEFEEYLQLVEDARQMYPDLPIRLGLEVDYLRGGEAWIETLAQSADFDYLIGSVHYISPEWAIDNPEHISRYEQGSVDEIWQGYFKAYESMIRTGLFDFVAHPDLPKKFGHRPAGDLKRFYEPVIQALVDHNVAFEINTAGLRKPVGEVYPAAGFIELAAQAQVPLLINSDAHAPEEVGAGFEEALALAKSFGYTGSLYYEKRQARFVAW